MAFDPSETYAHLTDDRSAQRWREASPSGPCPGRSWIASATAGTLGHGFAMLSRQPVEACEEGKGLMFHPVPTYTSIPRRTLLIAMHPGGEWSCADDGTPGSFETDFRFDITDDGGGHCLLVYSSLDGRFAADSWHETPDAAKAAAAEAFGIEADEWSNERGNP